MTSLAATRTAISNQHLTPGKDWLRLPGLFHRWELDDVREPGEDYFFDEIRQDENGSPLFAVYHRRPQ